jgi:hypothetical protein
VLLLLVAFVLSFLGATIFNLANGEPFTPAQVLWIHFVVNAPFGFALGFDKETPGLMARSPRPRGESARVQRRQVAPAQHLYPHRRAPEQPAVGPARARLHLHVFKGRDLTLGHLGLDECGGITLNCASNATSL